MINRASVELIQNLMSSRFEHIRCYSKYASLQDTLLSVHLHYSGSFMQHGKITCNFHIRPLRQDGCEGNELLVTQNVIRRFRANLVIAGVEPFEEDNWSHLIIGNSRFVVSWHFEINDEMHFKIFFWNECAACVINQKVAGQCGRCQMIGIDQDTGTKTKEPLMSLSAYRTGKVGQKHLLLLCAHAVGVSVCSEASKVHVYERNIQRVSSFVHFRWLLVCTWLIKLPRTPL